jgi:hypothetical protein
MQTLNGEEQALWKAWRRKNQSEWQTALQCRAIGQHWNNIKAIIKARRKAGEQITVAQWSEANAPVTHHGRGVQDDPAELGVQITGSSPR